MRYAYVGSRTTKWRNARGDGLKVYEINEETKEWKEIQLIKILENPSYLTLDTTKEFLYTVHGDMEQVSSFKRDKKTGELTFLNTITLTGKNPIFITPDKTNQYLLVATLQGGTVFTIKRNPDGSLGEVVWEERISGKSGANISHAHQCIWDQTKTYLFVPTQGRGIGYGQINVYRFHETDGHLEQTCSVKAREYAEPRHISIHPSNNFAYLINEKNNTMTYFAFEEKTGVLTPLQILSTLPDIYTGEGQASASIIDATGTYLIGSNRIHDSLVSYRINPNTGYLTQLHFVHTGGETPRFITFDEQGSLLYAANEDSDSIVELKLDVETGRFTHTGYVIETGSPVCIIFSE